MHVTVAEVRLLRYDRRSLTDYVRVTSHYYATTRVLWYEVHQRT
jgi:hypothetical protein